MKRIPALLALGVCLLGCAGTARATETENIGIPVLKAKGAMAIDGKTDDWELAGGVFACSDVENQRDKFAAWFHAAYDAQALYLLVRWNDETPLNNPGSVMGDYGFAGDCLQFRTITAPGTPQERTGHWTCWQDRDRKDVMDVAYGKQFNQGGIKDAKTKGARQAFAKNADGKGYVQELAIPWALLASEGYVPAAGGSMIITVEPNFTIGVNGRVSLKDIFKPGITPDRVFTFMANTCWGTGTFEAKTGMAPRPLRLADAREFAVRMESGAPVIDWTGLIKAKEIRGFLPIAFALPEDGYVSINLKNADGTVVRQLVVNAFYPKGKHTVQWDGLTTMNWRTPGEPVAAGAYTWEGLWHKEIGLQLRGWACNGGSAPWDSVLTSNWGGDHGVPVTCAADTERVYLGWSGAEAGKALLACDLNGNVLWKNSRQGMAGAELVAIDQGIVYAQHWGGDLYRLEAKTGSYSPWQGSDSADIMIKSLWEKPEGMPEKADGIAAGQGKLYLSFTGANLIAVLDAHTGKLLKRLSIPAPGDMKLKDATTLLVISGGASVMALTPDSGEAKPLITGLANARGLALDAGGKIYVGVREPHHQVFVFAADGKPAGTIGRDGGRPLTGKWIADGMFAISGMTVDAQGKLWVMEQDADPKRVSVWDPQTGKLVKDFFGPTSYGALGGAINPLDPYVMAGHGVEWRLDPKTGRGVPTGWVTRTGMSAARYAVGSNNRLYLATAGNWSFNTGPMYIFERVGEGDYRPRTVIFYTDAAGKELPPSGHGETGKAKRTMVWADANGDGERQPDEITGVDGELRFSGWYMNVTPDLTLYCGDRQYKVAGFTACGAPKYDLAAGVKMPCAGLGSADGRMVMHNGEYGVNNGWNECFDIASGKLAWRYPDNFVGVHGSHNACPAETGMIRGSFGPCGTGKLPAPIGAFWVIATNVGEWHILTENGFHLTRLFQPDAMKIQWPEAVPGASLDNVPCGMGGEDFGGSIAVTPDGKLVLQAGKTGFWNVEVTGLDTVKALRGGQVTVKPADLRTAQTFRESYLQETAGVKRLTIKRLSPVFTGKVDADFAGADMPKYQKQDDAAVVSAAAYDDRNLYLAWDVKDKTPWVNGATEAAQMYIGGDTVDFQFATDPKADRKRTAAGAGDLRLSIGPCQGKPVAVLYRKVATEKKPHTFSSGIVKAYAMDYVDTVATADIKVTVHAGQGYTVEAAIPLAALGLKPLPDVVFAGDIGVTHGDPAGSRTRLRSYWSNQKTGLVDDAVFELQMEPPAWGEIRFGP